MQGIRLPVWYDYEDQAAENQMADFLERLSEQGVQFIGALDRPPEVVVLLSADGSDDPAELSRLLLPIRAGGADLVIGSARTPRLWQRMAARLIRLVYRQRYSDLSPFRAIRPPSSFSTPPRSRAAGARAPCRQPGRSAAARAPRVFRAGT